MSRCPDCNNSSDLFGLYGDGVCSHCRGDGKRTISSVNEALGGNVLECVFCNGSRVCQTCGGEGEIDTPSSSETSGHCRSSSTASSSDISSPSDSDPGSSYDGGSYSGGHGGTIVVIVIILSALGGIFIWNNSNNRHNYNSYSVQSNTTKRDYIEAQIKVVGQLISERKYSDANKLLSQIEQNYPILVNFGVCGASERSAADYRVTLDQKLKAPGDIGQDSFSLDGVVTVKSPKAGSGGFWGFKLMSNDGTKYGFLCSASHPLRFQLDSTNIDPVQGYELLKDTYMNVRLIIPNKHYDYVMNKCNNKDCNGISPAIIIMSSSKLSQLQLKTTNIAPIKAVRMDFSKQSITNKTIVMNHPSQETQVKHQQIPAPNNDILHANHRNEQDDILDIFDEEQLQDIFEFRKSGIVDSWTNPKTGIRYKIIPLPAYKVNFSNEIITCRQGALNSINQEGIVKHTKLDFCRQNGKWISRY